MSRFWAHVRSFQMPFLISLYQKKRPHLILRPMEDSGLINYLTCVSLHYSCQWILRLPNIRVNFPKILSHFLPFLLKPHGCRLFTYVVLMMEKINTFLFHFRFRLWNNHDVFWELSWYTVLFLPTKCLLFCFMGRCVVIQQFTQRMQLLTWKKKACIKVELAWHQSHLRYKSEAFFDCFLKQGPIGSW